MQRVLPSWHPLPGGPRPTPPDAPRCPVDAPSSLGTPPLGWTDDDVLTPSSRHHRAFLDGPSRRGSPGLPRRDPREIIANLSLRLGSSGLQKEKGPASTPIDRGLWKPLVPQESRDESYPIWGRVAPCPAAIEPSGPTPAALVWIPFRDGVLAAVDGTDEAGELLIPIEPFCRRLGLGVATQRKKLRNKTWRTW